MDSAKIKFRKSWLIGRLFALLCLSAMLYGCSDDQYKGVKRQPLSAINVQQIQSHNQLGVPSPTGPPGSKPMSIEAPVRKLNPIEDHIRIVKGDLYYKFEWARSVLESQVVPPDLQRVVDDARRNASSITGDRAGSLINDILKLLQDGLDARDLGEEFKRNGLDTDNVDWSAGRFALQRSSHVTPGAKPGAKGSASYSARLREIMDYAEVHHTSPEKVMWEKFKLADQKTIELGKLLGLTNDSPLSPRSDDSGDLRNPNYLKKNYLND